MFDRAAWNSLYPKLKEASGVVQTDAPHPAFRWLNEFLSRTMGVSVLSSRMLDDGCWWVMFRLDIHHPKVWNVVQEFAHVCYGRVQGVAMPVRFLPFSTSPENGVPCRTLLWRIECYDAVFTPDMLVGELGTHIAKGITPWPPKVDE